MKASKIIRVLENIIREQGDKEVVFDDGENPFLTILDVRCEDFARLKNGVIIFELVEKE